jgi:hypothetical protein
LEDRAVWCVCLFVDASCRATDEIRTRPRPELLSSPINKLHGNQLILQHRSRNLNASRVIRILFKIAGGGGGAAAAAAAEGHETRHRPVEHQVRGGVYNKKGFETLHLSMATNNSGHQGSCIPLSWVWWGDQHPNER